MRPPPPIEVSPDRLAVWLNVWVGEGGKVELTRERIDELIGTHGIMAEIDDGAIDGALATATLTRVPVPRTVIAQGRPAQRGVDARLHFFVEVEKIAGSVGYDGHFDFHERNAVIPTVAGEPIFEVVPATKGVAGVDVFGLVIPARDGATPSLKPGKHVTVAEDGATFCSTIDGVLVIGGGLVNVDEVAVIRGDVDFSVGNVYSHNAVHIRGTVKPGFTVRADTHVVIDDAVEDAIIEAGGNVTVRGGVFHHHSGHIRAGGGVRVGFAQNAVIEAGGDIVITPGSAVSSKLQAGGRIVLAGGQGKLIGGVAHASQGVEARQIGSMSAHPTRVTVQMQIPELVALDQEDDTIRIELVDLDAAVAPHVTFADVDALFDEERRAYAREVIVRRTELLDRRAAIAREKAEIVERAKAYGAGEIVVRDTVYPGAKIAIGGATFDVDQEFTKLRYAVDAEANMVVSKRL